MAEVQKGTVTTMEGNKARVMSALKKGDITRPLTIAEVIEDGSLQKGTEVVYVTFEDMSGIILAKM